MPHLQGFQRVSIEFLTHNRPVFHWIQKYHEIVPEPTESRRARSRKRTRPSLVTSVSRQVLTKKFPVFRDVQRS